LASVYDHCFRFEGAGDCSGPYFLAVLLEEKTKLFKKVELGSIDLIGEAQESVTGVGDLAHTMYHKARFVGSISLVHLNKIRA